MSIDEGDWFFASGATIAGDSFGAEISLLGAASLRSAATARIPKTKTLPAETTTNFFIDLLTQPNTGQVNHI
jgi:hypothetical protein